MSKFDHLRGVPGRATGWPRRSGRARASRLTPAEVPEPSDVHVPPSCARRSSTTCRCTPTALGGPARAARRAGGARLAVAGGDAAGGGGDAGHPAYLESVASFYDMLELEPVGRHTIYMCTNLSWPAARRARRARALSRGDRLAGRRLEPGRGVPPALVRVPGRVRHRADGVDRGPLPRSARRRGRRTRSPSTCARRRRRTCCRRSAEGGVGGWTGSRRRRGVRPASCSSTSTCRT